jgi:hypothetical protein
MPKYWTSPDLSVSITEEEVMRALRTFRHIDWELIELSLPVGAVDITGVPLNRHNRYVRMACLAEALTLARNAASGSGLQMMKNRHFESAVDALLTVYDRTVRKLS